MLLQKVNQIEKVVDDILAIVECLLSQFLFHRVPETRSVC